MKKIKIVDKEKFLTFLLLILTIVLFVVSIQFKSSEVYSSKYYEQYNRVTVKEGDTIWDIAINNMSSKYDIRQMVYEIKKLNGINDSIIHPGDQIKIPNNK